MGNPELLNHIRSLNAAFAAEVPDAGCLAWVEDLEHWSSLGVTTPQQFDHFALVAEASDLSKEAFGFKRSWAYLDGLSDSELREEIAYYARTIRAEREAEVAYAEAQERDHSEPQERVASILNFPSEPLTQGLVADLLDRALANH